MTEATESSAAGTFQRNLGAVNQHALEADGERTFWCDDCGARCTRSPTDGTEYGHRYGCPRRPDDWPSGGTNGDSHHSMEG